MRKLFYYVLYRSAKDHTPAGIVIQGVDGLEGHGLFWNHRAKAWQYDTAITDLSGSDWDTFDRITREEAERATPTATGGQELPDEDTIWWIFQWKGDPPQNQD